MESEFTIWEWMRAIAMAIAWFVVVPAVIVFLLIHFHVDVSCPDGMIPGDSANGDAACVYDQ